MYIKDFNNAIILEFSMEIEAIYMCRYIEKTYCYGKSYLTHIVMESGSPIICHLQDGGLGKPVL